MEHGDDPATTTCLDAKAGPGATKGEHPSGQQWLQHQREKSEDEEGRKIEFHILASDSDKRRIRFWHICCSHWVVSELKNHARCYNDGNRFNVSERDA